MHSAGYDGSSRGVVAPSVGENGIVIDDGVNGLLVQPKDCMGMAEPLGRLIDDAGLRVCLGEAAWAKVERQCTVEHMTEAYEAIYSDLMQ